MAKIKFGDAERSRVIKAIEELKNIKLSEVLNYKKFLHGTDGSSYCIVGGTGDWHGIPTEVMDHAIKDASNFYLVIARLLKTRIELYMGPIKPVVEARSSLTLTQRDFQFDLKIPTNNMLPIKQVPWVRLHKVYEFGYDLVPERERHRKIKDFLSSLSPEQFSRILSDLNMNVDP